MASKWLVTLHTTEEVAQVLAKACDVSMDDRYRMVKGLSVNWKKHWTINWYPPSLPLESVPQFGVGEWYRTHDGCRKSPATGCVNSESHIERW